jgi:hypothetical protein
VNVAAIDDAERAVGASEGANAIRIGPNRRDRSAVHDAERAAGVARIGVNALGVRQSLKAAAVHDAERTVRTERVGGDGGALAVVAITRCRDVAAVGDAERAAIAARLAENAPGITCRIGRDRIKVAAVDDACGVVGAVLCSGEQADGEVLTGGRYVATVDQGNGAVIGPPSSRIDAGRKAASGDNIAAVHDADRAADAVRTRVDAQGKARALVEVKAPLLTISMSLLAATVVEKMALYAAVMLALLTISMSLSAWPV